MGHSPFGWSARSACYVPYFKRAFLAKSRCRQLAARFIFPVLPDERLQFHVALIGLLLSRTRGAFSHTVMQWTDPLPPEAVRVSLRPLAGVSL